MGMKISKGMCEEVYTINRTQNGWLVYVGNEQFRIKGEDMHVARDKKELFEILDALIKDYEK